MGFRRASSVILQEALSQSQVWTFPGDLRFFSQNAFFWLGFIYWTPYR